MRLSQLTLFFLISCFSFSQDSFNIRLFDHWNDPNIIPSEAHNNKYNEVWGFTQKNIEYGVIGSTAGTHIFDVNNPWDIKLVSFIPGETQGKKIIHRDFHDYKNYLYIVADENDLASGDTSKLKIVDLS